MRQCIDKDDVVGQPPLHDPLREEILQLCRRHIDPGAPDDHHQRTLLPFRVRDADDRHLGHGRVAAGSVFQVDRRDPLAARLDDVLGPVDQLHVAVGIDRRNVARGKVAVRVKHIAALALEVPAGNPGAAHAEMTEGLAVVRQPAALHVDDLQLDAPDATTLLHLDGGALVRRQRSVLGQQVADDADRAGLGHAPALHEVGAEVALEALDHATWRGRSADADALEAERQRIDLGMLVEEFELHQPYRRHGLRKGHLLVTQEFVEALPVELRPRHDQLGAGHGR